MKKKYPAIGRKTAPKKEGGLPCAICGRLTTGKVDVEITCFRGDDEQLRVCGECQTKPNAELLRAYAAVQYAKEWPALQAAKEAAQAKGDVEEAKKCRQRLSRLSQKYAARFTIEEVPE